LTLSGDWQYSSLLQVIAIGNGHGNPESKYDVWSNLGMGFQVPDCVTKNAHFTEILFDDQRQCYYLILELEREGTQSAQVSAVFSYLRRNTPGVFAAAFAWPFGPAARPRPPRCC
jgi:hypothetical protein